MPFYSILTELTEKEIKSIYNKTSGKLLNTVERKLKKKKKNHYT